MIPKLDAVPQLKHLYAKFLDLLGNSSFAGDIHADFADRVVQSTDNSVYQMTPEAVVYPKSTDDLVILTHLASLPEYQSIQMSPRGGGTGTNGQSLTHGILVDLSKYMNQVLEINVEEGWAKVQTGVVKDQLNAALKPYGLFFAPDLSTSNRATIGGMINTDASGQGSCLYGKTRDHVLELTTVLMDGSVIHSKALEEDEFEAAVEQQDRNGLIHRLINSIDLEYTEQIKATFPPLNRCLTGYDLAHIRDEHDRFNLNNILCGSEGTLGFIVEAKLNVIPIPKFSSLVVVKYSDFDTSLRDATELMKSEPTSIETIDSKVLNLAMNDFIWHQVEDFFAEQTPVPLQGINLVEFTGQDEDELNKKVEKFVKVIQKSLSDTGRIGYALAQGKDAIGKIWAMRKRAVGLLGNAQGEARPIPFVEDTAVPPEKLADFILEFRAILDSYQLSYGMFGHVDAGVLHVRPALDMKDPGHEKIAWEISDKVADLTHKYGGLLWGEHGKGVRSQYSPAFFGDLYPQLRRIKSAFDPYNQLNPGKIATPSETESLLRIDEVPTRGAQDKLIFQESWQAFDDAVYCNGNGACFNWNPNDAMCPSWKATRLRTHSPKGRASLMREWLKQASDKGYMPHKHLQGEEQQNALLSLPQKMVNTWVPKNKADDFSHEVYASMAGCLACKSCTGQCPIKVDVPEFRAKFLSLYHTRYLRPLKDYLVGLLEYSLPPFSHWPGLYNFFMKNGIVKYVLRKGVGFVDAPLLSKKQLKDFDIDIADEQQLAKLSDAEKEKTVIIVQDAFTSYFEAPLVAECIQLLKALDFKPFLAPYSPNGKPLHVHGFLDKFRKVATKNVRELSKLAASGVQLVGVDPSMTMTYRNEYKKYITEETVPHIQLLQEFLASHSGTLKTKAPLFSPGDFKLMSHCIESANAVSSLKDWQTAFKALGHNLEVLDLGCCGMSGTFGHEARNQKTSKDIYAMSWQEVVDTYKDQDNLVATGYSCRSQVKRESSYLVPHPLQALLKQLRP